MTETFIGLMSGTSIDAIDVAAVTIDDSNINVIASHTHPISENIKHAIASLCRPGENEIMRMGQLDFKLGQLFAEATLELLRANHLEAAEITALGSHGQTIRHMPNDEHPFTLQIGNPALICELTNITTVADFRRADIAAGGQGAPLVPAFHRAIFYDKKTKRVVLNVGGMANISIIGSDQDTSGFDTGPGNILLNEWITLHQGCSFDRGGEWSRSNTVNHQMLKKMLNDPYFSQPPPKSTGREYFNLDWVKQYTSGFDETAGNIQSTLCELTAKSVANTIQEHAKNCTEVLVCGGGVHNVDLMTRLKSHLSGKEGISIYSTERFGVDPDYVEAAAFAWFARQTLHNKPANMTAVTGARHPTLLGAIYPSNTPFNAPFFNKKA